MSMTSRERVRAVVNHKQADILPANFEVVPAEMDKLKKYFGFTEDEQVYGKFGSDIRQIRPKYIGPELKVYRDSDGCEIIEGFFGERNKVHWTGKEFNHVPFYFPLDNIDTLEGLDSFPWPKMEYFDFESIKVMCDEHKDKSITTGVMGPFQWATHLRSTEKVLMDMALNPEFAHKMFDRIVEFELEYYEKIFIAGDGQIDILKTCDDYGTQKTMLFGIDMFREYFKENTKKLVDLAHKYGAFFHQHSCGAIAPVIPELIDCGVDILEPIQKVKGMDPEVLKKNFGDKITFLGGIDTQTLLPLGTPEEVIEETRKVIDTLYVNGGYILMGSQSFEIDIPVENIIAMYSLRDPSLRKYLNL